MDSTSYVFFEKEKDTGINEIMGKILVYRESDETNPIADIPFSNPETGVEPGKWYWWSNLKPFI